MEKLPLN